MKISRHDAGFTLIELTFAILIAATIGALAVPALFRARGAAAEVSAIASLRAVHGAQTSYATSCGFGYYAPTVKSLQTPPGPRQPAFLGPEFKTDTTTRQSYHIRFTPGTVVKESRVTCNGERAGRALSTFYVGAELQATTGGMPGRYFGVNQTGVMFESTKRIAAFYTGTPPSPARPLR